MSVPNQMYTNELNPIRGYGQYHLDKPLPVASSTVNTVTPVAGMVGRMYETAGLDQGKFALGLIAPTTTLAAMPIFLFKGQASFDVTGDDGNLVGAPSTGTTWGGNVIGLVASGAFELETTAFTASTNVYSTGKLLVADTGSNLGNLTLAPSSSTATMICGVVSDGSATAGFGSISSDQPSGPNRLRFWPVYMPKWS